MVGQAKINGIDIANYGALLVSGAYEALLTPPAMKEYVSNTSRNAHGVKYTIPTGTAVTDEREVSFSVFIEGDTEDEYLERVEAFLGAITDGVFTFDVPRLKKRYKLLYKSCSKYGDFGLKRGKFTLKLVEPNTKDRETI